MEDGNAAARDAWNGARFRPGTGDGHYESWFQRANHPWRPLAFWIRYTIFQPAGRPGDAVGELWAIWFDGEAGRIAALREAFPLERCRFAPDRLEVAIGQARLSDAGLSGEAAGQGHRMAWDLRFAGGGAPLLLLPRDLYDRSLPKAKALVGSPNAIYDGRLVVDGVPIPVEGWQGSQNHNWGSRHTDRYAWGQVAGFDGVPDAFLECTTARVRLGPAWSPLWSPWMTLLVLRLDGREHALNGIGQALRARGRYRYFEWEFDSAGPRARIRGRIHAPGEHFVALTYGNPPGGDKTCLNCKIAACELVLERPGAPPVELRTRHRAAFEILTGARDHGVPVVV
ncbi:MAG: hypothetical protein JNK22_14475 [Rhodocyclaceae bacterium]|nr:hypothetical protein [Rhodocyclaceae bacterium]